jgi:hypothetical protein
VNIGEHLDVCWLNAWTGHGNILRVKFNAGLFFLAIPLHFHLVHDAEGDDL